MSIAPIILTLGIIVLILSFIIPLILKLMNKKDGKFRSNFFVRGTVIGVLVSLWGPFFQNISVRVALKNLKLFLLSVIVAIGFLAVAIGFLAVLGIIVYLIMKFDNWLEEDKKEL